MTIARRTSMTSSTWSLRLSGTGCAATGLRRQRLAKPAETVASTPVQISIKRICEFGNWIGRVYATGSIHLCIVLTQFAWLLSPSNCKT